MTSFPAPDDQRLRQAVQALAQPADVQILLYPDFVVVGDELAIDFGDALEDFRAAKHATSAEQDAALAALDQYLSELSGPPNEEFWLDRTRLAVDPRWERIRELAKAVLVAFSWPDERPPPTAAIYVGGSSG